MFWAAGFLEGEGHFKSGSTGGVRATQKQREPLDRLKEMFGGGIYPRVQKGQTYYQWCLGGARGRGLLMTLYALMSPRRKQQILAAIPRGRTIYTRRVA